MSESGRDLWRSSGPIPLLKQGNLQPAAQDHIQTAFDSFQHGRLHNISAQPVPLLSPLTVKQFFLMFRGNILCFSLCQLPLVLSLGTTEKNLARTSLHSSFRYLYTFSLLFSRLHSHSSLSLSSNKKC